MKSICHWDNVPVGIGTINKVMTLYKTLSYDFITNQNVSKTKMIHFENTI